MKVKERGAWVALNEGKGGKRPTYDAFNKSFKGQERNPTAQEFASQGIEAYHRYSERAEVKEEDVLVSKNKEKKNSSPKSNALKNIISKVGMVVAGSVVVVSTYVTMAVVDSQNWIWSDDNSTVSVELVRRDGVVIKELPSIVTISVEEPTCNQAGLKTYTATAEDEDGTVYTDEHNETLSPLGHDLQFIEKREVNGKTIWVYECPRCHEQFTFENNIEEID